jgi:hypothetical protein
MPLSEGANLLREGILRDSLLDRKIKDFALERPR